MLWRRPPGVSHLVLTKPFLAIRLSFRPILLTALGAVFVLTCDLRVRGPAEARSLS